MPPSFVGIGLPVLFLFQDFCGIRRVEAGFLSVNQLIK